MEFLNLRFKTVSILSNQIEIGCLFERSSEGNHIFSVLLKNDINLNNALSNCVLSMLNFKVNSLSNSNTYGVHAWKIEFVFKKFNFYRLLLDKVVNTSLSPWTKPLNIYPKLKRIPRDNAKRKSDIFYVYSDINCCECFGKKLRVIYFFIEIISIKFFAVKMSRFDHCSS